MHRAIGGRPTRLNPVKARSLPARRSRICENFVNFCVESALAMTARYRQIVALSRDCIEEIDPDGRITSLPLNGLVGLGASSADQRSQTPALRALHGGAGE
ncbi:hypothetical protein XAP412_320133 [Xanthomonas phaseoli pv. phaseoli]|uniref:Uncharacterized protein n=1 Tax=Xanthomonas campestris pv. phaseoli TaxID=317013 RepID=A0AB38E0J0_XANCH|nr:hypothetical protein XAP6984_380128 [Xanthomonas phaseoli pv. phaseoli]SON83911.1 hypothetical protein XAP412_320133 [Xanthomonas phaseoli pv. phaseoli]SON88479.1 hypothetical protein XAP7430_370013 [Xanthomonas phaseoli pv. phaseoli]SOO27497.1 hypothetical protein XAP6164_1660018 [Xanthomonas phaseoli pv. phaseoli]